MERYSILIGIFYFFLVPITISYTCRLYFQQFHGQKGLRYSIYTGVGYDSVPFTILKHSLVFSGKILPCVNMTLCTDSMNKYNTRLTPFENKTIKKFTPNNFQGLLAYLIATLSKSPLYLHELFLVLLKLLKFILTTLYTIITKVTSRFFADPIAYKSTH